jgi:hypothetical protein
MRGEVIRKPVHREAGERCIGIDPSGRYRDARRASAVFLASDASRFIGSANPLIDGGYNAT